MLTHFDYEVLNKKIDTLSEKVDNLSLLVDKLLGGTMTANSTSTKESPLDWNTPRHALSTGSFTDAGIEQTWRSHEHKTK